MLKDVLFLLDLEKYYLEHFRSFLKNLARYIFSKFFVCIIFKGISNFVRYSFKDEHLVAILSLLVNQYLVIRL